MDWVLALCIATAVITGLGLLFVIAFASGKNAEAVQTARVITDLKKRNFELGDMLNEQIKCTQELETRLKENESIRSQYAYHIRELAKEIRDLKKGIGDFALDA